MPSLGLLDKPLGPGGNDGELDLLPGTTAELRVDVMTGNLKGILVADNGLVP